MLTRRASGSFILAVVVVDVMSLGDRLAVAVESGWGLDGRVGRWK